MNRDNQVFTRGEMYTMTCQSTFSGALYITPIIMHPTTTFRLLILLLPKGKIKNGHFLTILVIFCRRTHDIVLTYRDCSCMFWLKLQWFVLNDIMHALLVMFNKTKQNHQSNNMLQKKIVEEKCSLLFYCLISHLRLIFTEPKFGPDSVRIQSIFSIQSLYINKLCDLN